MPILLAVIPATLVSFLIASASPGMLGNREVLEIRGGDLGSLPALLWPLWAPALGAATLAYDLRRRGHRPLPARMRHHRGTSVRLAAHSMPVTSSPAPVDGFPAASGLSLPSSIPRSQNAAIGKERLQDESCDLWYGDVGRRVRGRTNQSPDNPLRRRSRREAAPLDVPAARRQRYTDPGAEQRRRVHHGPQHVHHRPRHLGHPPGRRDGGQTSALERARASAGDQNVTIAGGAATVDQYLAAGLIDELRLHIAPVTQGAGERLFDGVRGLTLEPVDVRTTDLVTHLTYRVTTPPKDQ